MAEFIHYTVMKNEVVDSLNCYDSDKIYVDCTLGGGGHSEEILKRISPNGRLIAFDVDEDAINHASKRLEKYKNLTIIKGSYASYADLINEHPTGTTGDAYLVNGELYVYQ